MSEAEIERAMNAFETRTPWGLRDRAMLEFLYSTAVRASELARIAVADLDLDQGLAAIRLGKGAKDRMAPLTRSAVQWLRRYLQHARPVLVKPRPDVPQLFVSRRGGPFYRKLLSVRFRALSRQAGLAAPFTCHTIRRSVATLMLKNGASPAQVAALLGHGDLKSLARYVAHARATEVRDAHAKAHPREEGSAHP